MGHKQRKDVSGVSKAHALKRHHTCKHHVASAGVHKASTNREGARKVKTYIKKALNFGVEAGYLIPSNHSRKLLRVASDLMSSKDHRTRATTCDRMFSQDRDRSLRRTPARFEDYEVQDARRRRRRRGGRSRSGSRRRRRSRRRGRRRSRSNQPEEVGENEFDDYDLETNDEKRNNRNENPEREQKNIRSNPPDGEKGAKREDDGSDMSLDDDDTDEEDDKKSPNNTKS